VAGSCEFGVEPSGSSVTEEGRGLFVCFGWMGEWVGGLVGGWLVVGWLVGWLVN
jgi:hypothetical protein